MREERGQAACNNHLALLVTVPQHDTPYLVDVGFGGSLTTALPLGDRVGYCEPYRLGVRRKGPYWQFWENSGSGEFSYDFQADAGDETRLAAKCADLQTNPESGFVKTLVAQRRAPGEHRSLRGKILKTIDRKGTRTREIASSGELCDVLAATFGLDVPAAADLWPKIVARHEEFIATEPRPQQ